jgi:hypothetical protein
MWSLAFGHHEDRTPTHGYAATREDAMAAFAKSWRREVAWSMLPGSPIFPWPPTVRHRPQPALVKAIIAVRRIRQPELY